MERKARGKKGEELAALYLERQGYQILKRNYRLPQGEIDLVAREGNTLAFIEVRTKSTDFYGTPAESISERKKRRLRQLAAQFLAREGAGREIRAFRFDVVAISFGASGEVREITLLKNAF